MKNIYITVVVLLVVGVGAWLIVGKDNIKNNNAESTVVARVNGEAISRDLFNESQNRLVALQGITLESLDEETRLQLQTQVVNSLVSQELLSQAAISAGVVVADEAVDQEMLSVKSQFADEAKFNEALVSQNTTEERLRFQIKEELIADAYLRQTIDFSTIVVTDAEVTTSYEQVAETQEVPPLSEVRDQVMNMLLEQKRQALIATHLEELRAEANIEILI